MNKTPTTLIIMDGFGLAPAADDNAVTLAKTPVLDKLFKEYAHTTLSASGLDVGLPAGQMGNSEVGHTNIGGGRVVFQDLPRISRAIEDGSFFRNEAYNKAMDDCLAKGTSLHLYGLLSDGGVHSHIEHLFALLQMAKDKGLTKVYIHCFLDGRDVSPTSGKGFVQELQDKCAQLGVGRIATVMGRYYAMDRDKRWERVQMAYDKIKQRHFVYYNHVVKPALVGLAGPWISGGIEFNWPQHHRPSTFMPVDTTIEEHADGSVTVWVNEMERMFHQKGMAGFTLRPGCAYLEIKGVLYNRTDMPQTFLWWANPAVAVNDYYQSVFPPDVNAVFDHGKRAVSSFPIATGTYYKMDYSAGIDISNYKNIKVPTSYMGVNSRYDFEGGYENDTQAGMLHVASHHVSPGKKQWTWGNGDFGRACH